MPASRLSARSVPALRLPLSALALGVAVLLPQAAQAQSLKELYEAARAYDAAFLSAKALAASADYRVAAAEGLAKPSAKLTSSATTSRIDPPIGKGGDSNSIGATLQGTLPLINRSNDASIAQARRSLDSTKAELEIAEQDLMVRVAQAYFDVLASKDTLGTVRANKAAITEQLASAKRNFEVGTATITGVREAQAAFDQVVANELAADNDLRTKRIALDQLVGRNGLEPKPVQLPLTLPPVQPADVEAYSEQAQTTLIEQRDGIGPEPI